MGGRGRKQRPLTPADGLTACHLCNSRYESDLQPLAYASGWKIRRNYYLQPSDIPFWDRNTNLWKLPDTEGGTTNIPSECALKIIEAAGGKEKEMVRSAK